MQNQWHYEQSGKRLGPIGRDQIEKLIAEARIERSTLVWNPTMPQWTDAVATDLASHFGDEPPPLPASEISRWAVYALALFPLIGLAIQAVASAVLSASYKLNLQEVFDHHAWWLLFLVGNGVLGDLDERYLRKGGLRLRGGALLAAFLVPVYIYASCRTFRRHAGRQAWSAYVPFLLWCAALVAVLLIEPLLFNPDAPLIFRPDEWL